MTLEAHGSVISLMLAVPDATGAAQWYEQGSEPPSSGTLVESSG